MAKNCSFTSPKITQFDFTQSEKCKSACPGLYTYLMQRTLVKYEMLIGKNNEWCIAIQ